MPRDDILPLLVGLIGRSWHHERERARLYRALGARAPDADRRALLGALATSVDRHADRRAAQLTRLGIPPREDDPLLERLWRWWLVRRGPAAALGWIAREEEDERALAHLLAMCMHGEPRPRSAGVAEAPAPRATPPGPRGNGVPGAPAGVRRGDRPRPSRLRTSRRWRGGARGRGTGGDDRRAHPSHRLR